MSTPEVTLRTWPNTIARLFWSESNSAIEFTLPVDEGEPTVRATDMANTIRVPSASIRGYEYQQYKSVVHLAGKYAGASFLRNLPDFLERYDHEIDQLHRE
jgi:hypothetical protein